MNELEARADLADEVHATGTLRALRVRSHIFVSNLSHADAIPEAQEAFPDVDVTNEAVCGFLVGGHFRTFDDLMKERLAPPRSG